MIMLLILQFLDVMESQILVSLAKLCFEVLILGDELESSILAELLDYLAESKVLFFPLIICELEITSQNIVSLEIDVE